MFSWLWISAIVSLEDGIGRRQRPASTRPTKDNLIEFGIPWNLSSLQFKETWSNHKEILHTAILEYATCRCNRIGVIEDETTLNLSQRSSSGNPVAIQCARHLDPSVHWNATGERILVASVLPVVFQWSFSGFPVVFQCVPIMQINTGTPLGASISQCGSSAFQCTCGSSGLPVCSNYAN